MAPSAAQTRWDRIVAAYDAALTIDPQPGARLARAVAIAEGEGPAAGLAALEGIEMPGSHRPAAVRAEFLSRQGRSDAAREAYAEAIEKCQNDIEKAFLQERVERL